MSELTIKAVRKSFGETEVLKGVDIEARSGSFVSLLGASGCGKSTLLRCIAGLETVSSGEIFIGDQEITELAPEKRQLSMMFQSYALFPHMNVLENVRFPLRMNASRFGSSRKQRELAEYAIEQVRMAKFSDRMPSQLSGGQQQRVALARAIVGEPRVLLLDEPLSNLDARLREDMQVELIGLQRELGLTTVFVTHDQDEAMTLSDQLVLMRDGQIEQSGSPEDLYRSPQTLFAADFLGAANLISVQVDSSGGLATLSSGESVPIASSRTGVVTLVLRQNLLNLGTRAPEDDSAINVIVVSRAFRGGEAQYVVKSGEDTIRVTVPDAVTLTAGERTQVSWSSENVLIL